jgi:hypothetical protein
MTRPAIDRFLDKILVPATGTCWLWGGARNWNGYGHFGISDGHTQLAHRFAYEFFVGPIPMGLQLDHLCRARHCVNPDHLEPVTNRENARRGAHGLLVTHCPQGHLYSKDNTRIGDKGERHCRTCERIWAQCRRDRLSEQGLTSRGTERIR